MSFIYTDKEKTEKTATVKQAIEAAAFIAKQTHGNQARLDTSSISHRNQDEKITIAELNEISDTLLQESFYPLSY